MSIGAKLMELQSPKVEDSRGRLLREQGQGEVKTMTIFFFFFYFIHIAWKPKA